MGPEPVLAQDRQFVWGSSPSECNYTNPRARILSLALRGTESVMFAGASQPRVWVEPSVGETADGGTGPRDDGRTMTMRESTRPKEVTHLFVRLMASKRGTETP